ncbi:hypothetical protein Tco_0967175 [Tanacetum coccineum]
MFDESLNPPPYVDLQAPKVIAPIPEAVVPEHVVSTVSPSSTIVDQDAPSPRNEHHDLTSGSWELVPPPEKACCHHPLMDLYEVKGLMINEIYGFESCDSMDTPMVENSNLDDDKEGKL